ncbi:MAG: Ig-like domain-containing protein [Armatimonas sp.]
MKTSVLICGLLLLSGGVSLSLSGCGGASSGVATSHTGRATVSITWPERTRLIPVAANSIKVTFYSNNTVVATQTATRPAGATTSTLAFDEIPAGSLAVEAVAYPNPDGTGNAQARASTTVTIIEGQITPVNLTMASTISSLAITPSDPIVAIGNTINLGAVAADSSGSSVLISASTISWSSSNNAIATVSSNGVVTAVAAGTATITATDRESGKTATTTIRVVTADEVFVSVSPSSASLSVLAQQAFTATVTNAVVQNVTWSITEGAAGGTITAAGVYTAPSTPGTYHIVATSVAYPTKSSTATVLVQGGNANVTVK